MTVYNIFDIANWFLAKEPMAHKKLQKLCYYAVAWGYALLNRPICTNAEFEAWVHGPVSPMLYEKYQGNGWVRLKPDDGFLCDFDDDTAGLLESIWLTYGHHTATSIAAQTHTELPWIYARCGLPNDVPSDNLIEPAVMRKFYLSIYTGGEA